MPVPSAFRSALAVPLLLVLALGACAHREAPPPAAAVERNVPGAASELASCGVRVSAADILQRINRARAAGHRCGARAMGPAHPLKWDASLYAAAAGHSRDMARRNYFEHQSPEGRSVTDRARAQRYPWKSVGENIAAGTRTLDDAMRSWLDSAEHCRNIMDPGFDDVAVACVQQPGSQWGTYWTMVLGRK